MLFRSFSLGIVLYEITVGRRLFRGTAQDVVSRLVDARVEPPTHVRRGFPPVLETIVMRALEKHVEDRYQSAYDLADDLEMFLRESRLHSGPVRIARYLDALTTAAGGSRRPELVSEAETGGDSDDLDFDRQVFDAFVPSHDASDPSGSPEWDDTEQSEAEVAAALGLELAELRALRTPVPMRRADRRTASPRGFSPESAPVHAVEQESGPTDADAMALIVAETAAMAEIALTSVARRPAPVGFRGAEPPVASSANRPRSNAEPEYAVDAQPTERHSAPVLEPRVTTPSTQSLPWILVATLAVAVVALVAYMVMG